MTGANDTRISMSALLGALSLSTDAANGARAETALRTAVLAAELAARAGLEAAVARTAYWTAMLRFIGCTGFAHETARMAAGDDLALLAALQTADPTSPRSVLARSLEATRGRDPLARLVAVGRLATEPSVGRDFATAHCAQAESLASLLGADASVREALGALYERWDGEGNPRGLRGDAIDQAARVVHVAAAAESFASRWGADAACDAVRAMGGRGLDPTLAARFLREGRALLASIERRAFERAMEVEPGPRWTCAPSQERAVFTAFARFVDLKSPFTLGHSTGVAALVERVGRAMGLGEEAVVRATHGALVHDIGRVAVANGVWDATGPLGRFEWDSIRSHAVHTERILSAGGLTRPLCDVAVAAHERADESGYPHGRAPRTMEARILAACDVAVALGEDRPHRPALARAAREAALREEVNGSRLDPAAVDAIVALWRGRPVSPARTAGALSEREVEVLVLLARGGSNKDIAASLGISPRTVQHHVAHVYEKTGVRSRAAAALFAVERGLAGRDGLVGHT